MIGILALQGSFHEHAKMVEDLGYSTILVRSLADVEGISALIIPGGESTTLMKLLKKTGLDEWLKVRAEKGLPIFGTCAGAIVLSRLGILDAELERNAYGRQLDSFEKDLDVNRFSDRVRFKSIFIRAPKIVKIGHGVEMLVENEQTPVLIKQKNIIAGTFHPELTSDSRIHRYFLSLTQS